MLLICWCNLHLPSKIGLGFVGFVRIARSVYDVELQSAEARKRCLQEILLKRMTSKAKLNQRRKMLIISETLPNVLRFS